MAQPDKRDVLLSQITVPTFTSNKYTSEWIQVVDWERVVGTDIVIRGGSTTSTVAVSSGYSFYLVDA
tara:strand:- start:475 stop:675 length:201 start_codon:yes stop_codon:yes gene_type:complete